MNYLGCRDRISEAETVPSRLRHLAGHVSRQIRECLPQNNVIPRLKYAIQYATQRRAKKTYHEGFSIVLVTRNRKEFLACAVDAVMSNTNEPYELIIIDNASDDGTSELCQKLAATSAAHGIVRHVRLGRNYGTNAYALGFLLAKCEYLVDMDDDILALSKEWDLQTIKAFRRFPSLGLLAMNVIQDKYTNGGKHLPDKYFDASISETQLQVGPTGGWFAITTRRIYDEVGGFIFRPYKPFVDEDGKYIRQLAKKDYFAALLKNKFVYHACGPYWNGAYGYKETWDEKYGRDHKHLLPQICEVRSDGKPTVQYAQLMLANAERS